MFIIFAALTYLSIRIPQANSYIFITTLFTTMVVVLLLLMQLNKGGDRLKLSLHKEAFPTVFFASAIVVMANLGFWQLFRNHLVIFKVFSVFSFLVLGLILYFFRRPASTNFAELNTNQIISPAYGKVVNIEEKFEKEHFNETMKLISIFMSPLDIHANWVPIDGVVEYFKYYPGKYLVAFHPKSSELNEHSSTAIVNERYGVLVKQIAGFMARKIVSYIPGKGHVAQLDELGFIRFGSRVDVFMPLNAEVKVKKGERMIGGKTILAEIR